MPLEDIVNVTITRETVTVEREAFDLIAIIGPNVNTATRLESFTKLSSIADALAGGSNAPEYLAAQAVLSQNPRCKRVALGHMRGSKTITDNAGTFTGGSVRVVVCGHEIVQNYSSSKDATLTALAVLIEALAEIDTAVYNAGAHTIVITPETGYVASVVVDTSSVTGTMTAAVTATVIENITDALNAINEYNAGWYGLVITSRTQADQEDAAAWAEANRKIAGFASSDTDIVNVAASSDTTSLAAILKATAYARSFVVYCELAATQYPEAALLGRVFPLDTGSWTSKFKTLAGITVSNLTPTQESNALAKNCFIYTEVGGVNITAEGKVAEGEWLDTIVNVDWLHSRITEEVFTVLVRAKKVPYDDTGINTIGAAVSTPLQLAIGMGMLTAIQFNDAEEQIGGYIVNVPKAADVPSTDKNLRILNNVTFTAWLAGAIHAVTISGTVTV